MIGYCRKHLKQCGLLDKKFRAQQIDNGRVAVPVSEEFVSSFQCYSDHLIFKDVEFQLTSMTLQKKRAECNPKRDLLTAVKSLCMSQSVWSGDLALDLPRTWEKHGDLLLLPSNCFLLDVWKLLGNFLIYIIYN